VQLFLYLTQYEAASIISIQTHNELTVSICEICVHLKIK